MRGEIRIRHWLVAIVIAISAQLAVLAAVFSSEPVKDKPGQAGIVLQLTAVATPGDSLANPGEPVAASPLTNTPPPPQRKVAKVAPKPKPKPKPKQPFKFKPKPDTLAVRTASVPRVIEQATSSMGLQSKEPVTKPKPAPKVTTKTDTTDAVGSRTATGPLAAALPSAQSSQTKAIYEGKLLTWIAEHKRYPRLARRQGLEGVVEVTFQLDPRGRVQTSFVSASSGYAILDQAVMRLLEQASPMPTPPDSFDVDSLTFRVPVAFTLR